MNTLRNVLRSRCHSNARSAFTLPELLMVVAILAIMGAIAAGGLAGAASRTKADTTKNMIRRLSDVILEQYASYEDLVLTVNPTPPQTRLQHVRLLMREQMPDCWADVAPSTNIPTPTTGIGRAYQRYKQSHPVASSNVAEAYESAECLYMIVTRSGLFPDFLESIRSDSVGDVDRDGRKEFLDGWGRPIAFRRWAPGFSPYSPVQPPDPVNSPDPIDVDGQDSTSYALIPLIFSAGPDEATNNALGGADGYGIVDVGPAGWPTAVVTGTTSGNSPTTHLFSGNLVGAPNPSNPNAFKDNLTNHQLLVE